MSRLILLAGADTTSVGTLAAATVTALADEGFTAALVNGSEASPADPATTDLLVNSIGRVFAALGADSLPPEAWAAVPGLGHLSALLLVDELAQDSDVVVVDAGSLAQAQQLVELPAVLERLLDAALSPSLAMWRTSEGEDVAFDALAEARRTVSRLGRLLLRRDTTIRLVVPPTAAGAEAMEQGLSAFSTLGVGVEGVILHRYPRKGESWPADVRHAARRALATVREAAGAVAVWKSSAEGRPAPKGRSAAGPFGHVQVLDHEDLGVRIDDESLALDLPLAPLARRTARVGVTGEQLVVAVGAVHRWIELPAVLRRCRPLAGVRTADGVRLEFEPDPGLWMGGGEQHG